MSRLIFVPQYPTKMRYSEWWIKEFKKIFRQHFTNVIILGEDYIEGAPSKGTFIEFSPVHQSIEFELAQIDEYRKIRFKDSDVLFLADISFPGLFPSILFHRRPKKCFAFCHATAKNKYDYYTEDSKSKFQIETGLSKIFDGIFVGSKYNQNKIGWTNTIITRLPPPPDYIIQPIDIEKTRDIVSVARYCKQKVNKTTEDTVSKWFGTVERGSFNSWKNYSRFLSSAKILLITTKEDTFNYTIMDAIKCGCIPVAPNKLCFPEILPREYLYDNSDELYEVITNILNENIDVPKILCQTQIDEFYNNICSIMKE